MRRLSPLAMLIALSSSACSPTGGSSSAIETTSSIDPLSNKAQVIVMLGQSNMEGHTHSQYLLNTMGQEKTQEYVDGYDDVLISYACTVAQNTSNGTFVPVKLGQGTSTTQFGPEVGMAETLSRADLKYPVFLVKFAQGATSLHSAWRSPSSGMTGSLYGLAVEYINQAMGTLEGMGYYPEIKAICWMQGEDDSTSAYYDDYLDLERAFVADLRKEFAYYGDPSGIGFVDAAISDSLAWTHRVEINQAKQALSLEDDQNVYIDTISAGLKYNAEPPGSPDIYHYDSSSMVKLGNLFAEAVLDNFLEIR